MYKLITDMKLKKIITLFFTCVVFLSFNSKAIAQEETNDLSQFTDDDYLGLVLPPIDTLFARIGTTSKVNYYEYRKKERETLLKTENRKWLNYLRFSTAYQYGYLGGESIIQGNLVPTYYQNTKNAQNYYHIGVAITIPFDDLIDRRNKINQQKMVIEQLKYEKEAYLDEQKLLVIEFYSIAIQSFSLLKVRNESLKLAEAGYKICQENFINGKVDADALSQSKHAQSIAGGEYETVRAELNNAILKLEVLCNYRFTKHNK